MVREVARASSEIHSSEDEEVYKIIILRQDENIEMKERNLNMAAKKNRGR